MCLNYILLLTPKHINTFQTLFLQLISMLQCQGEICDAFMEPKLHVLTALQQINEDVTSLKTIMSPVVIPSFLISLVLDRLCVIVVNEPVCAWMQCRKFWIAETTAKKGRWHSDARLRHNYNSSWGQKDWQASRFAWFQTMLGWSDKEKPEWTSEVFISQGKAENVFCESNDKAYFLLFWGSTV